MKSRLLIGATGFAAVAMSTAAAADGTPAAAAPAADPAKWLPYADITAGIGSGFSAGQLDLFAPVWQDLDSLLFARGGLEEGGQDNSFWNFGLGYRTKIAPDWILGVYANYDRSKTDDQMMTHQWSGGAELMNEDWDFRVNGYLAPDDLHASGFHGLYIHDTTIAILQGEEGAYSGFDGEVGYRVFNTDNTDVRLFAGGFWFDHSGDAGSPLAGHNFDFHDIKGPKARAEVNMFSIDGLGAQSRLSLEGEVAHDSVRGTTGFVGATLRIALNDDSGPGAQALDELDRRMADPERRQDNVLTQTIAGKPEPVIIYNANIHSQPTNTLYYAQQQATTGIGSYANPTTIQDATARGPVNQFIVVTDKGGPVVATGAVVQTGETVVGGGETFKVRAVTGGPVFTHTFAPGSGTPTLTADSAADNALTVAGSNVVVSGLNFAGPFAAAIYGHNVTSVTIDSVNIDGTGGGVNGVVIDQDVSGNSTITIQNSSIANVSNDGVNVNNTFSDGGTTTENLHLDNTSVSNSGNDGVYVGSNVSGGSTANLNTELTSSSITGSSSTDVLMGATVAAGSTVNQNITIDPTTISGGTYGVQVNGTANGGTLNQYVGISDVDFSGQSKGALAVSASGSNGAVVTQTVNLTDVTITGSDVGINLGATATTGAHVSQYFALSQVSVTGAKYAGISITAHADGAGSVLHQYGTLADITASNAALGDGVYVYAESTNGGTTIGRLNVTDLTATGNKYDGLYVGVEASSSTANASVAAQYVSVTGSNLWGNRTGFEALAEGTGNATAAQNVFVGTTVFSDTAHSGTESDGALIEAFAFDEGSVQQSVYLANDTAQGAAGNGVEIDAASLYGGFAAQTVQVYGSATALSQITDNSGFGISVSADASNGGDIEQNIDVYYVNASHNTDGGLKDLVNSYGITAGYSLYYSHVSQNIIAFGDHFDRNGGDGVGVVNYATYGAGIDQFVYLGGSTATHNTGSGIHVNSQDVGASSLGYAPGTHLYSDVSVYNSTLDRNGVDGITIQSSVTMPDDPTKVFGDSYLEQHVVVSGVTAEGNHGNGFTDNASATGIYSLNLQYITLQNSNFNDNRGNGAAFTATQYFGPYSFGAVLQDVTITSAQFNNNAGDGIHAVADASGFQGRAEQYFSIFYSQADGNHGNGMSFYRHSHDGAYYPGFACNTVQGLTGGCGIIRQTVQIGYSDISGNRLNGIDLETRADNYGSVYAKSGRPAYTSSFFVEGSTIDANHGDGLHVYNYVGNHSYEYQYVVALNTTIDSNHGDGIGGLNNVTGNSQLIQKVVLYGISADTGASNNGGSGIDIDSQATAGGNISSLVVVGFAELDGNHGDGISVNGGADSGAGTASTSVAQYVDVISSDISGNHSYGIDLRARANNAYAVTYQYLSLTNSTVSANHNAGVHAFEIGYNASAADQSLYFNNDTITNNNGDGVYAVSISVSLASTQQNVLFGYKVAGTTNITGNHGDGIYVGTAAFSGAQAEQNVFVYDVNSSHNRNDGLGIGASANGYGFGSSYIYYSHVSQNVVAAYDTFDHNGGNGMSVSNVLYYGGAMNQLVEAIDVDMSHNHGAGFYSTTHLTSIRGNSFSFSTNISSDLYLIGDTIDHNLANGIDIRSYTNGAVYAPAFFGGYNYMEMHNQISGTTADNNGGSGLSVNTNTTGRYSLNAEYFTISGSTFDHNHGDGAAFTSTDNYGPGGFGDSYQHITISGSDFSSNAGNGLDLAAFASGNQGRAEQHVTVTGSTFDHNGGDGVQIYASAINGTYITGHPCDAVQGLPGGCAFVRQNVTIEDSIVSNNDNNGVNVGTYANNYGAIYGVSGRPHAPTVELYGDTVNDNGGRGLNVSNHVTGHSYLYQYVAAIDSSFNNNHSDGVYLASYVGGASTMLQRALLYSYHTGSSASGNGGNGFKSTIEALGGSYAHDVNLIEGVKLDHDGSFGFDGTVAYADGSSTGLQINAVYFNSINHNGDGAGLYSIGAGAQQISFLGGNDVIGNSFVGVYGEANFGAFQYIGVYTLGNTVHGNGTNYLFNSFGGSTQILN